ncbi:MAG: enolase C-terminal domain-like protein [Candidatus Micrarchaeia archaeon]
MIREIRLRKIFDSRGMPTVEAEVSNGKHWAKASSPSGTSRSAYEAFAFPGSVELGIKKLYAKKGKLLGIDELDQKGLDEALHSIDGTERFSEIGGNIATAISIANAKLAAIEEGMELYELISKLSNAKKKIPRLLGNVLGGGAHSQNGMSVQEVLVSSKRKGTEIEENVHVKIYGEIGRYLESNGFATGKTIENAWTSRLDTRESIKAVRMVGEKVEKMVEIGVDMAASTYFKNNAYNFDGKKMQAKKYAELVEEIAEEYSISYIEDPFESSDFRSFSELNKSLGKGFLVVGDDLYATNSERIKQGKKEGATGGVIIKVNQAGTLTDAINAAKAAAGMKIIASHRSGETEDTFLAHVAVGLGADYIKCGVVGGERISKINELARIEKSMKIGKSREKKDL